MLVRRLMTTLSWLCYFCMQPLPSAYKSSHALLVRRGVSLWTDVHPSHPSPTPSTSHQCLASKIKQTFLSTNLAYLLAFVWWAPKPHLWVTVPTHHRWESTLFLGLYSNADFWGRHSLGTLSEIPTTPPTFPFYFSPQHLSPPNISIYLSWLFIVSLPPTKIRVTWGSCILVILFTILFPVPRTVIVH